MRYNKIIMVAPLGIPAVYQMLVGAGALAGGAVATNQMRKEIQSTIDKDPGIMDQALKSVFMGPASQLINPNLLSEIQDKKPTTTDQGQKKAPPSEEDIMKGTLFYEQTPSGIVLGPTVGEIEKGREEARSKPLITIPGEVDTKPLSTPVPEKTNVLPGMDPAPTPAKTPGFSMPTTPDTSILNQDKPEETKNQIKTWEGLLGDKFKNVEEVKQRSEKDKIPFEEVELAGVKKQIKFKKSDIGYNVYFDGKLIGNMSDVTQDLKNDNPEVYKGNQKIFNLSGLDARGNPEGAIDTVDSIAEAKTVMADYLAKGLLDKESPLRKNFENQKYDQKGNPLINEQYQMSKTDKKVFSLTNDSPLSQFKDPSKFLAKDKNTKQYIEATNPVKIFGNQDLRAKDYSKELPTPIEYRFDQGTYQKVYDDSLKEINDKVNVNIEDITKKFGMKAPDINLINKSLAVAQNPDERYWYQKSGGYLKDLVTTIDPNATPKDVADFIDIVSVTSGGVEPKQNLKIALGVYSDMKQNQPMLTGFKTAKSLDKYLSNKEQAVNTPKFGNFTDTMKYFAGVGDREPNVVNDLQMAKLFGVKPDQLASNPELYNAMTTTMNNITKEVNKNLPEGQELQPFELQSLMWSQSRGMASNYEQVGQELIKELNDQGIDVTKDVMTPDFAERLQKTITPYKESMKATIEVGSFLTPQGKQIEQLINQYGTDERLMGEVNKIHRKHLKSLITKQAKQPSIMEEVLSNVLNQKVEVSRMQEGIGTYEGKSNYNVIVPLTVTTSKGPRPLTEEERLTTLALLGKNLNQAAMAASNFKAGEVTEGRMSTGQIYVKSPVDQIKIQELHKQTGYDYNITPVAGGFIGSVISFDGKPDKDKIQKGFEKVFGKNAEMDYIDSSWKGDYLESNNYERYINGIQNSDVSGVEGEGATRKYRRDIDSITKKIQNISSARDRDYSNLSGSNYVQKLGQSKPIASNEASVEKETK